MAMATKPSAAAASLPPPNSDASRIRTVSVKCVWWNTTKTLDIKLIFDTEQSTSDATTTEEDNDAIKYSFCSLLLQLGKVFQIKPPPYAPSPRISSIFNKLLECWSLQRDVSQQHHERKKKKIEGLAEIQDGDELLFLFGDYFQKISPSRSDNDNKHDNGNDTTKKTEEVDLLELLPKKYNLVTVEVMQQNCDGGNGKEDQEDGNTKNVECIELLSSSSGDEVEDVTDMYIKSRPSPGEIEVEDASDSDESDWEKDEYGNLRRTAAYFEKKRKGNNDIKSSRRGDDDSHYDNYSLPGLKKSSGSANDNTSLFDSVGDSDNYYASGNDGDDDSSIEDVTDIMLAKRQEEQQKMMEEAELLETDSEDEDASKKRKRNKRTTQGGKRRKVRLSPIEVVIEDEDVPDCPGAACQAEEGEEGNADDTNDVDLSIKQRIIKLLNTGLHNDSNEHEAKNAMKLARRLLDRYNLDQAVLLKERGDGSLNDFSTTNDKDSGSALHGGIVTVHILNRKKTVPLSSMPRWLENLISPVTANFRVDAFTTFSQAKLFVTGKCSVSFFGIKTNAQLAAYAFKTAAERIAFMTASYEPPRSEGARKQASQTRTARLSYALGVVAGLNRDVKKGLQEEEQKRQEELKRARNAAKTGEAYQEDEDCNDEHDDEPQQQQQESIPVEEKLQKLEDEHEARLALVDCNKKIAEDVLKVSDLVTLF